MEIFAALFAKEKLVGLTYFSALENNYRNYQ